MPLRPLNDNIIIDPDPIDIDDFEVKRVSDSGILVIPDIAKSKVVKVSPMGKIVSWGSRCKYKYVIVNECIKCGSIT